MSESIGIKELSRNNKEYRKKVKKAVKLAKKDREVNLNLI